MYLLGSPRASLMLSQLNIDAHPVCVGVPSVRTDTAPLRARAPCSWHPAASRASTFWPVAPVLLVFILVLMSVLWAAVLLCIRVIVVLLVWVHAGVRLVPWTVRLVVAAAVLTVLLILTVVSKQLLCGRRKGEYVCKRGAHNVFQLLSVSSRLTMD